MPSMTGQGLLLARAHRVERGPDIDGDVLGDVVWTGTTPVTGFRQNTPDEGEPASERTEVRILYTDDTIYFGVICFVRDPDTIIVSAARRDSSLAETDSFRIVLDTYRDQQNGFVFGTNPAGTFLLVQLDRGASRALIEGLVVVRSVVGALDGAVCHTVMLALGQGNWTTFSRLCHWHRLDQGPAPEGLPNFGRAEPLATIEDGQHALGDVEAPTRSTDRRNGVSTVAFSVIRFDEAQDSVSPPPA